MRIETLDVTDVAQARALAARVADVAVDVLINNAGVYNDRSGCASQDEALSRRLVHAKLRIEAELTVANMIRTIERTTLEQSGRFWRYDGVPEALVTFMVGSSFNSQCS